MGLNKMDDSPKWLPDGWTVQEKARRRGSRRGSVYKVYTDVSSRNKFYSRAAVTRYLSTVDHANIMTVQTKCDNVNEPVPNMSPQCTSMTNTGGMFKEKKVGNSFKMLDKVDEPPPKCLSMTNTGAPQQENEGNSSKMLDKVDGPSTLMSPQCLPMTNTGSISKERKKGSVYKPVSIESYAADDVSPGWIKEIITSKSGSKIRKDPYYTDPVSGYVFRSKLDALRYVKTNDIRSCAIRPKKRESSDPNLVKNEIQCDNVNEPVPNMSPQCTPMTNTGGIFKEKKVGNPFKMLDKVDEPPPKCLSMANTGAPQQENEGNSSKMLDKVDGPSTLMSPQCLPMMNTGSISKERKKGSVYKPVSTESSAADDVSPGWIKGIITSKSGSKIRKDPYYTDPVSGYVFRSKLDALRYVKTNDIRSCAIRPKKRELSDPNLVKNEIQSSSPEHENLPEHKRRLFPGGELNGFGESSGAKRPSNSEAKILKRTLCNDDSIRTGVTHAGSSGLEDKIPNENPSKNTEMQINPDLENEVSKDEPTVMDVNATISPPVTNSLTKQTERTQVNSTDSRKRKVSCLPSRTSKRFSMSEPETPSTLALNEHPLSAAAKSSSDSEINNASSASVPLHSDVEPAKEPLETPKEIEIPNEVENPPIENPVIAEEQIDGKADENRQESQLCFDFGDSWSDPLEFALKTLRGEIPIDDALGLAGCFSENSNQLDGCLGPSQPDLHSMFQNDVAPNSVSSKQQSGVHPFQANSSSFSAPGNVDFPDFSGFNNKSSEDVGEKDSQTKFDP